MGNNSRRGYCILYTKLIDGVLHSLLIANMNINGVTMILAAALKDGPDVLEGDLCEAEWKALLTNAGGNPSDLTNTKSRSRSTKNPAKTVKKVGRSAVKKKARQLTARLYPPGTTLRAASNVD